MKETGGAADDVTDDEIREGIRLLAENEGIFAETAGGVTVGVAKKLIASGKIPANDSAVLCITGNGLKTLDAVVGHVGKTREIKPSLREFEAMLSSGRKSECVMIIQAAIERSEARQHPMVVMNSLKYLACVVSIIMTMTAVAFGNTNELAVLRGDEHIVKLHYGKDISLSPPAIQTLFSNAVQFAGDIEL